MQFAYGAIDLLCVWVNGTIAYWLRFPSTSLRRLLRFDGLDAAGRLGAAHYYAFLLLYAALVLLLCHSQNLYRTPRTRTSAEESVAVAKAVAVATLLLSAFIYLSGVKVVSRLVVACCAIFNVGALIAWRAWKRRVVVRRLEDGIGVRNALVIGAGRVGQALARQLEQNKLLGYCFRGFLDQDHATHPKLLGKVEDLPRVALAEFVDDVFITVPSARELVKEIASQARLLKVNVKVVPELYDGLGWEAPIQYVGSFPVMELHEKPIPAAGLFLKRAMDAAGAALGLTLLSPLLAAIALVIRLDSPGPILYASPRVGKKGRKFTCYKFRTMIAGADDLKQQLRSLNERKGPFFKMANDPRLTRLGKILRRYSLDELPQLWNVLKGEMSLVGPRPHPLDDFALYELDHLRRLDVKPGLTGLWQVKARRDASFEASMSLDLEYIENWNFLLDLKVLLWTIPVLLRAEGV